MNVIVIKYFHKLVSSANIVCKIHLLFRPAHNVLLRDATFPPSDFKVIAGMPEAKWDVIAAGANVTHALVVEPHRPGYFNFSSADITYKTIENTDEVQVRFHLVIAENI